MNLISLKIFILINAVFFSLCDDHLVLLSATLRTFHRTACNSDQVNLRCPRGTNITIQLAQYRKNDRRIECRSSSASSSSAAAAVSSTAGAASDASSSSCQLSSPLKKTQSNNWFDNNLKKWSLLQNVIELCQKKTHCQFTPSIITGHGGGGGDDDLNSNNNPFGCRRRPMSSELTLNQNGETQQQNGGRHDNQQMEFSFKCRPYEFRSKIACENEIIQLVCNPYGRLAIFSANYGRTEYESVQCVQPEGVVEKTCLSSYATETVMHICHGKRKCMLSADTATFGRPCQTDSRMYLKVIFTCVHWKVLNDRYANDPVDPITGHLLNDEPKLVRIDDDDDDDQGENERKKPPKNNELQFEYDFDLESAGAAESDGDAERTRDSNKMESNWNSNNKNHHQQKTDNNEETAVSNNQMNGDDGDARGDHEVPGTFRESIEIWFKKNSEFFYYYIFLGIALIILFIIIMIVFGRILIMKQSNQLNGNQTQTVDVGDGDGDDDDDYNQMMSTSIMTTITTDCTTIEKAMAAAATIATNDSQSSKSSQTSSQFSDFDNNSTTSSSNFIHPPLNPTAFHSLNRPEPPTTADSSKFVTISDRRDDHLINGLRITAPPSHLYLNKFRFNGFNCGGISFDNNCQNSYLSDVATIESESESIANHNHWNNFNNLPFTIKPLVGDRRRPPGITKSITFDDSTAFPAQRSARVTSSPTSNLRPASSYTFHPNGKHFQLFTNSDVIENQQQQQQQHPMMMPTMMMMMREPPPPPPPTTSNTTQIINPMTTTLNIQQNQNHYYRNYSDDKINFGQPLNCPHWTPQKKPTASASASSFEQIQQSHPSNKIHLKKTIQNNQKQNISYPLVHHPSMLLNQQQQQQQHQF